MKRLGLIAGCLLACSSSDPVAPAGGAGAIQVTISGEALARDGFAFPPAADQEASFIDGWEVKLDHFYVSFGDVTISEEPDKNAADQSVTGAAVAKLPGTFVADLSKAGPEPGKGEGDNAWSVGTIANQTLAAGKAFDASRTYAFGYSTLPATASATRIAVDAANADVQEMIQKGYSVFYVGKATFKGTECSPNTGLETLPTTVAFRFGFKTEAQHINCENPDLGEGKRGLALKQNSATVAQITYHADHPFWNAIEEDAPLRFDHLAFYAKAKGKGTDASPLLLEDLVGASLAPVRSGTDELKERTCKPADAPSSQGSLSLDPKGRSVKDLAEFMTVLQAPQAHLNADGLCATSVRIF